MREIKFRAKRIDNGEWVYGDYFNTPLTDENSGTLPDAGWFFLTGEARHCIGQNGVAFVVDSSTVGQFTGLHDKNGKEIYEGDLLGHKFYSKPVVVSFKDGCFISEDVDILSSSIQIIGNIHDNPELLKPEA